MQTQTLQFNETISEKAYLISAGVNPDVIELAEFNNIGRATHNEISLNDVFVSQRHARIEKRGKKYLLKDLRSRNGTFLNETQVQEASLNSNDKVRIGETVWTFSVTQHNRKAIPTSKNAQWQEQLNRLPAFATTNHTVLILGPSGSGKEVIANLTHQLSPRRKQALIAINCSALSEQLIESELFGHIKGAFTGAAENRKGAFEAARGGTLFLDEIGDLPISLQPKLLRALENQQIRPVGSDKSIQTDVRLIAATHKNLYEKVLQKEFREDLYHRLNVCRISPPALADRMEDFEGLAYSIAKEQKVRLSFEAIEAMKNYSWPGNVRELKNTILRASAYYPSEKISVEHLKTLIISEKQPKVQLQALPPLKQLEREMIISSLKKHKGNQRQASEELKMPKSTLNDKIRNYGLDIKSFKTKSAFSDVMFDE